MNNMALYLADGIEKNRLDYFSVFSIPRYDSLKVLVDEMLVADGFQNLIVPMI